MLFSFKLHYDDEMVYAGTRNSRGDEMKHLIRMKHGSISLRRERATQSANSCNKFGSSNILMPSDFFQLSVSEAFSHRKSWHTSSAVLEFLGSSRNLSPFCRKILVHIVGGARRKLSLLPINYRRSHSNMSVVGEFPQFCDFIRN